MINISKFKREDPYGLEYRISFDPRQAPPNFQGTMDALMDALELHHDKALDYDGDESEFGIKGEIFGITRKVRKLKRIIWDGKDPLFEDAQELAMDLIGSTLLLIRMQKTISDKYAARWRVNLNKPNFGPAVRNALHPTVAEHVRAKYRREAVTTPSGHANEDCPVVRGSSTECPDGGVHIIRDAAWD